MKLSPSKKNFRAVFAIGAVATGGVLLSPVSRALEIKLPAETVALTPANHPGYEVAMTFCVTCHSAEYVRMQPPNLTPAYWKATVLKMKKAFGAPIPDEQLDVITDYIVKTYGAPQTVSPVPPDSVSGAKKSNG
jgi:sulfite dehydrogenase